MAFEGIFRAIPFWSTADISNPAHRLGGHLFATAEAMCAKKEIPMFQKASLPIRQIIRRFLPLILLAIVLPFTTSKVADAQDPKPKDTPAPYTIAAHPAPAPPLAEPSCMRVKAYGGMGLLRGLGTRGGVTSGELELGVVDMTAECIAGQVEATVPNGQRVGIQLLTAPGDECIGIPSFNNDPKPDYISIITAFLKPLGLFDELKGPLPTQQRISLPPAANGTMTISISCKKTPNSQIRTAIIHFTNPPQFSASAGTLVSLYGKHVFGVSTSQTGVSSTGVVTTQNTISLDTSKVQFVPVGFLNTYISGTSRLHFDLQAGLGINPNGSKTEVEYFFGPALSTHGIYISPGLHIARAPYLEGGFALGEIIPSGVTPPISYRATYRFAFAISYSPAVKSSK
jgi:hypothetical protein